MIYNTSILYYVAHLSIVLLGGWCPCLAQLVVMSEIEDVAMLLVRSALLLLVCNFSSCMMVAIIASLNNHNFTIHVII
jgi:hypothetical protein